MKTFSTVRVVRNLSFVTLCAAFVLASGVRSQASCSMPTHFQGAAYGSDSESAQASCNSFGNNGGCDAQCSDCGGSQGYSGCTFADCSYFGAGLYKCYGDCSCEGGPEI